MSPAVRHLLLDPPGQPPDRRPAVALLGLREEIERAWPAVDAELRRRPDYRLILAVSPADRERAQRRFSHERVVAAPPRRRLAARFWRRWHGVALIVDAGDRDCDVQGLIRALPPASAPGRSVTGALGRMVLSLMRTRRLTSLVSLRQALGVPHTIVCLGNGPSCEDAALARYAGASLFRVNWTWRSRTGMTTPDAVFTADPDLPPHDSRAILVFPRAAAGLPVLLQHCLALRPPRAGYLFADELLPPLASFDDVVVPTNGALMIAAAAAVAPRKLVIAGMDLYRHPAGRYPGSDAVEGYARGHSADCDLALIRRALDGYRGEIEILSPNLAAALGRE